MIGRVILIVCVSLAALAVACGALAAGGKGEDWKLCLKTYSLHLKGLTFFESVDKAAALGIKYLEAFPGQKIGGTLHGAMSFTMDAATRRKVLEKCRSAGVTLVGYGVASPQSEAEWHELFAFAKAMGVRFIVSEPDPAWIELVDKLSREYAIDVAIHNHPQPSHYWKPEAVLAAAQGCGKRIGACADTGHWVRSGLDPVQCLKKLDGRIIMLHFKDLSARDPKAHDVVWGTGACDVPAMLAELRRQHFKGYFSIEYENPADVLESLPRIVTFFNRAKAMSEHELREAAVQTAH